MSTARFIETLNQLKDGDIGLLRQHAFRKLDESLPGFDLFTGIWWPIRQKSPKAPKRETAWLIAKLYAFCPLPHVSGVPLAKQLKKCTNSRTDGRERIQQQFDLLLTSASEDIEPPMRWALGQIKASALPLDWVKLTDDLSVWNRESTRLKWAKDYLFEEVSQDAD